MNALRMMIVTMAMLVLTGPALAQQVTKEQIKGLDEQVQEIKSDALAIAAELKQLEEKLLYPSDTQVAVFVSMAGDEKLRLDAVEIHLDGKPVARHIYSFKELEAMQKGGVQRIHTGNIMTGAHELQATFIGKTAGGSDFRKTQTFTVSKEVGPKIVELTLANQNVMLKDW